MKSLSAQGRAWFQIGAAITTRSAAARRSQTATTPSHASASSLGTGAPPMTAIFASVWRAPNGAMSVNASRRSTSAPGCSATKASTTLSASASA